MGKAVEAIAVKRGHQIAVKADAPGPSAEQIKGCDAAIEFTGPASAVSNILTCFKAGVPAVVGSTGWYDDFNKIKNECITGGHALLTATNFSVGVNIFFELNRRLADLMQHTGSYSVAMDETHHIHKLDSPSGTAITLADDLVKGYKLKEKWEEAVPGVQPAGHVLPIYSHRKGETVGTHVITYTSEVDKIEIRHEAFSRDGFALGAVVAAEWLADKKGVFTMKDVLGIQ